MATSSDYQIPSLHFPDRPQFSGFMRPCRVEGEVPNLEVYGEIPPDIDGSFYRVMPDPQFPPFIENDPVRPNTNPTPEFQAPLLTRTSVVQRRRKH